MKNFILGLVVALALAAIAYMTYPLIQGWLGGKPVAPSELQKGAKDFGTLKVHVSSAGQPVANLEVDLGEAGGRMSYTLTDVNGTALFENVAVGSYNIFFNDLTFPQKFIRLSSVIPITIAKGQTITKEVELKTK